MAADGNDGERREHVNGLRGPAAAVPKLVHRVKDADEKLVAFVRKRPLVALGAAAALGYLIGRVLTRLD